jgi:Chaperone of endosialidase
MKTIIIAVVLMFNVNLVLVQVPRTLSYQGVISGNGKTSVADGKYNITFLLYVSETGNDAVWEETQETSVESGVFNTVLGIVNPLLLPFDKSYWLGIKINGGDELTPRTQLTSSPYSFNSISISDSIVTGKKIADKQIVRSINSLKDHVKFLAGDNIDIVVQNNSIEISSKGSGALSLPFSGEVETNGSALDILNKGAGHTASFSSNNPDRVNAVLQVTGGGKGNLFNVLSQGQGAAAFFEVSDPENQNSVITGNTGGLGIVAEFNNFNELNQSWVLSAAQHGLGPVANLQNLNGNNTMPALELSTLGSGPALMIHSGTGNIAEFQSSNQTKFFIDESGNLNTVGGLKVGTKIIFPDGSEQISASTDPAQYWKLNGNANTIANTSFIGTTDSKAFEIKVNSSRAFRFEPVTDQGGVLPNVIGGSAFNWVVGGAKGAAISGGGEFHMKGNRVIGDFGFIGGGFDNTAGINAVVGGGMSNMAKADFSIISGGEANQANGHHSTVAGGSLNKADDFYSTISGGRNNVAKSIETGAATVGGGEFNQVLNDAATVGGGKSNTSSGSASTISGGANNIASGQHSTVAGGSSNKATANQSAVGGGEENIASGQNAAIPGSHRNQARGDYSFAAGYKARAATDGSFVWNDRSVVNGNDSLVSTADNQFLVRAKGGVDFKTDNFAVSNSNNNALFIVDINGNATLAGTLVEQSDRNAKMNFSPVSPKEILAKISILPISTWSYKDDPYVKHIGPMAQDFKAAFGVGVNETTISVIDRDGVAFAAIQALQQMLVEKENEIQDLLNRMSRLEQSMQ